MAAHRKHRSPDARGGGRPAAAAAALPQLSGAPALALAWILYPALIAAVVVWCAVHPLMDPDIWLHMAFGRYVLEHGAFPPGDVFSFTAADRPWMSSGWAASVLFQAVYSATGPAGLVWFVCAVVLAVWLSIYFVAAIRWRSCGGACALLLFAALASYLRFTPRPEIFSHAALCAAALLLTTGLEGALERRWRAPRRLWLLPPLFALWANMHAGFVAGLVLTGLALLWLAAAWNTTRDRELLRAATPLALCFVAWLLNPYGIGIALLSQKIKSLPGVTELVNEWKPMFTDGQPNQPLPALAGIFGLMACWVAAVALLRGRIPWWQTAAAAMFAALELREIRHTALASIVLATLLLPHAAHAEHWLAERLRSAAAPATAGALVLFAAAIMTMQYRGALGFGSGWPATRLDDSLLPFTATRFMQANRPPDNLYNSYGPGGYLMYHLGPETRVFIDGRNDVYDAKVWTDFYAAQDGAMALDELHRGYGVNSCFILSRYNDANPNNLANRLTADAAWALVYFDDNYALFVRRGAATARYLRGRELRLITPFSNRRLAGAFGDPQTRAAAAAEARRVLEISGGSAKAHLVAANIADAAGNRDEAQSHARAAAARDPFVSIGGLESD